MPTNARVFRYFHFSHDVFTDTMFAGTKSKRGNTAAQVFATSFGWSRAYPMKSKGYAHEALSDFLKTEGIPPNMIMDGSKEQLLGNFKRKLREVGMHPRQIEPYSPWQNAAEGAIKEGKKWSARQMTRRRAPKKLWDYSLELAALVRSHTALDIYMLDGETPEMVMKGWADISHIGKHAFFDFIMF